MLVDHRCEEKLNWRNIGDYNPNSPFRLGSSRVQILELPRLFWTETNEAVPFPSHVRDRFLLPDAGVRHRVEDIRQEIHGDIGETDCKNAALNEVVVAVGNGLDRQSSDARPREDRLCHDGSREQSAKLQSQHRENWDHRVAQRVTVNDGMFRQAFSTRGADVVLAE